MDTQGIDYHLSRALRECAERLDKDVGELTLAERNQAFHEYRVAGRHLEKDAVVAGVSETYPGCGEIQLDTASALRDYAASCNRTPEGLTRLEQSQACLGALLEWGRRYIKGAEEELDEAE